MKSKSFIFLFVLIFMIVFSLSAVSADDLQTTDSGEVSGDVDVVSDQPYTTSGEITYDIPADAKDIKNADVYVNVYSGSAENTYGANANVTLKTVNGENQIASEELWIENGTKDGTVYPVNNHTDKCYSDYQMRYDITDALKGLNGTSIGIKVDTFQMEGKSFDGRIKLIALVLAYDDGDNDVINYWVDSSQRWTKTNVTTTFDTSKLTDIYLAHLLNIALSSKNGNFTLNDKALGDPDELKNGSTYQCSYWDVSDKITEGQSTELVASSVGSSLKNALTVLKVESVTVDVSLATEYSKTCFAGTENALTVKVKSNKAGKYLVELLSDDGSYVSDEVELDGENETSLVMIDPKIRPIDETTVNGANNTQVTYEVAVSFNSAVVKQTNLTVPVLYNGYLGKDMEYDSEYIEDSYVYTVSGGLTYVIPDDSTYMAAGALNRTDVWETPLENISIEKAFIYLAYNWDKSGIEGPVFNTTFNGHEITPKSTYRDQSNLGSYGTYGYGLYVYDVTDLFEDANNTFFIAKEAGLTAVYPSALVALYNLDDSEYSFNVYMMDGVDLLSSDYNNANRTVQTDSEVTITPFIGAQLYVFAASDEKGEGNIMFNGEEFVDVWNGTSKSLHAFSTEITDIAKPTNEISFVSTGKTILALNQIILTRPIIADVSLMTEYTSVPTCYAGTNNTLTIKVKSDTPGKYNVTLNADGVAVNSTEVELDGENETTVLLTDPTIRPVDETTVNGANNTKDVDYFVVVDLNGETVTFNNLTVPVLYNGNLGYDYEYGVTGFEPYYSYQITGDVVVDVKDASTYLSASAMNRTDVWTVNLTEDSELVDAFLFIPYNWFNPNVGNETEEMFDLKFNGLEIVPDEYYRDQGNLGKYGQYGYGVLVYRVTNLINSTGDNTLVLNKKYATPAVYPSALVYLYDTKGGSVKDVSFIFGADLLSNSNNNAGRIAQSDSQIELITPAFDNATIYVLAASAQKGESNIVVNGKVFEDVWNGTSSTTDVFMADITDVLADSNNISFVATGSTILALPQILVVDTGVIMSVDSIKTEYTSVPTAFAGTSNLITADITVSKDGEYTVVLLVDGYPVDDYDANLTNGTNTLVFFDDTLRDVDETTVNGADNQNVTYTVVILYDGCPVSNEITVPVLYNGYLSKDYEYNATYIEDSEVLVVTGGVEVVTQDDSTYMSTSALNRTDVFTIELDNASSLQKAYLYVAYNWDKTGITGPVFNATFNGNAITPKSTYRDQGNLGKYGSYGYGLYIYDVTEFAQAGNNTLFIGKEKGLTAVYPSNMIYLYNTEGSQVETTVYMFNGADLLSSDYNVAERFIWTGNTFDANTFDMNSSALYVFAASAQKGEGDITFNQNNAMDVWNGSSNSLSLYYVDVTDFAEPSNDVLFISTGSTILALNQMFVVTKDVSVKTASGFRDIVVNDDLNISMVLVDENGKPVADANITYVINGNSSTIVTAADGSFVIPGVNGTVIEIIFEGNEQLSATNTTITVNVPVTPTVVKVASHFNITGGVITINGYAVDTKAGEEGIYYATELLDADGNPIKGVKIQFAVNDKIYNRTTKENGSFNPYKLNMIRAGRYTMAFYFAGDDNYTGAFASVCVDLDKKPIKIKASNKSYKASTKTKKYTVTLSTKVCSSHDGKAHLRSGLKVTLTVNGKTYNGKTNSKGQVTFKITNLKNKAKYKAKISYAGDITYESATKTVTITAK